MELADLASHAADNYKHIAAKFFSIARRTEGEQTADGVEPTE
jgi:hypothetical protein